MYTFNRAAVLPAGVTPQWLVSDISSEIVSSLYSTYRKVVLGLLKADGSEVFVDTEVLRASYSTYGNTLLVLLQTLGDTELETVSSFPTEKIKYVRYGDINQFGYKADLCRRGFNDDPDYPRSELSDVEITRESYDTDLSLLHTHCLISVNGFYHDTDTDGERTYIVDGGKSVVSSARAHFGILSFMNVGAITKRRIALEDIRPRTPGTPLKNGIEFSVSDNLEGKSVFLVLGGYLVFPEDTTFYPSGEKTYQLTMTKLPYLERILESREFMDISSLKLTKNDVNPRAVNLEEIWSDEVLKRYLTMTQSYLVIVDTPSLALRKIHIRCVNVPGLFITTDRPKYPLIAGFGHIAEYWSRKEDGAWANIGMDTFRRNYVFNRQSEDTLTDVSDQLAPDKPFTAGEIFLLEISTLKGSL